MQPDGNGNWIARGELPNGLLWSVHISAEVMDDFGEGAAIAVAERKAEAKIGAPGTTAGGSPMITVTVTTSDFR